MTAARSPSKHPARKRRVRARRGEGEKLRDEILDAYDDLFTRTGDVEKVSIRAVADAVGVSPPSIYLHFTDKDALVFAACNRHFKDFRDTLKAADDPTRPAGERLMRVGRAYFEWGMANTEAYRVMFMDKSISPPANFPPEEMYGTAALSDLAAIVAAGMDAGEFRPLDVVTALMVNMDRHEGWDEHMPAHDDDAVLELCLENCVRGLRA